MKARFKEAERIHLGHNVQRIREIIGIKQIDLGMRCDGWSQQQISKLEQAENIDESTLEILAVGLGVTPEFIKNFKEEKAIYNIQNNNTFHDNSSTQHYQPTITNEPADKIVSLLEKFIDEDKKKTNFLETLAKAVSSLAEQVEHLKKGK